MFFISITPAYATYPTQVEILNQEIDPQDKTPSYYRILVNRKHIKHVTIDPGIYNVDDLCFPPIPVEKLPPLPKGDWNWGRISQNIGNPTPFFAETLKKNSSFHHSSVASKNLRVPIFSNRRATQIKCLQGWHLRPSSRGQSLLNLQDSMGRSGTMSSRLERIRG